MSLSCLHKCQIGDIVLWEDVLTFKVVELYYDDSGNSLPIVINVTRISSAGDYDRRDCRALIINSLDFIVKIIKAR